MLCSFTFTICKCVVHIWTKWYLLITHPQHLNCLQDQVFWVTQRGFKKVLGPRDGLQWSKAWATLIRPFAHSSTCCEPSSSTMDRTIRTTNSRSKAIQKNFSSVWFIAASVDVPWRTKYDNCNAEIMGTITNGTISKKHIYLINEWIEFWYVL